MNFPYSVTDPRTHRWVMVSGAPRSGTTFVGTVLGLPKSVNTLYEPYNPNCGVAWNEQRYLYVDPDAPLDPEMARHLDDFFSYRFSLKTVFSARDSRLERIAKRIIGGGNQIALLKGRLSPVADTSLIKDPIAVFLTEIFARRHAVRTVLLTRHPLSFVGSLKRLGWRYKVEPLLAQPALAARVVPDLGPDTVEEGDWIAASAWIWTAIARYVLEIEQTLGDHVLHITHEKVSEEPEPSFHRMFDFTGIRPNEKVWELVRNSTEGKDVPETGKVHDFNRNSQAIFSKSIQALTEEEQDKVLSICWDTAQRIYADPRGPGRVEERL